MMCLVHIDAELTEPLELLEALIGGKGLLAIQLIALIEVTVLCIDRVGWKG